MFLGAFALFLNCRKEENTGFFVGEGGGKEGRGAGPRSGEAVRVGG